jgi:hypothetical protein
VLQVVWLLLGGCRPGDVLPAPAVVVNEVLAKNDRAWVDPDGPAGDEGTCPEHDDFVELVNRGPLPIAVGGYTLADESGEVLVLPPALLAPGEHLVIVADEQPEQGPLHAPFGVSAEGEALTLFDARGQRLDQVDVPPLEPDQSWGRYGDGGSTWRIQAAPSPGAANEAPPADPCALPIPGRFDDHTVPCIGTREAFFALADERAGTSVVKFDLLPFLDDQARHALFLDTRFYALHDEWYLFRMLNGQPVEVEHLYEPYDGDFATIREIYDWAETVDLEAMFDRDFLWRTPSGRITSFRYYDLALGEPRAIGVGTLIHVAAAEDRPERWAFELEYADDIRHDELVTFFESLEGALAPDIGQQLRWLVRSPVQEALAVEMEGGGLRYSDRLLRYHELSAPGAVDVFNEGTAAGRVRVLEPGAPLGDARPDDVLVLSEIPDELPPCAALITAVPQTPLAHIALLARSRGIPNLHVAGLADDPQWNQWSRVGAKVAIRATAPDGFDFVALSEADYQTWVGLQAGVVPAIEPVDGALQPWAVDPEGVDPADVPALRPVLGGKSAGYALLAAAGVPRPDAALALTVRAYQRQVEAMDFLGILADPVFASAGDPRGRWLVLEGQAGYGDRFPEPADAVYAEDFLAAHPSDAVGDLARSGGLRARFEGEAMVPEVLAALMPAIEARFAAYAPEQGLRFRSSSSVEDVEGFVGAGLYTSETGYLDPDGAGEPGETIERALMAVFGSYWGFEAFEERHAVGIAHEAGAMGVLVHAAFQDELEEANGVMAATRLPDGGTEVEVNAQAGAISVANPPTDGCVPVLPEVAVVRSGPGGPTIERLQASTERPDGEVLSDEVLLALLDHGTAVLDLWLDVENVAVPAAWARSALTLDLELRVVAEGWPVRADGVAAPGRLVLKQARSLEPSAAGLPEEVREAPFPRDVLGRARWVTEVSCRSASHALVAVEALTDPRSPPDLGYAEVPFTASLEVDGAVYDHLAWGEGIAHPRLDPWEIEVGLSEPVAVVDGVLWVGDEGEPLTEPCVATTLWASPDTFLDDLLGP